jgi:hypothetical protein
MLVQYVYSTVKLLGVPGHYLRNGCEYHRIDSSALFFEFEKCIQLNVCIPIIVDNVTLT